MGEAPCSAPAGMLSGVIPGSLDGIQHSSASFLVSLVLILGSTAAAEGQENLCATARDAGSQHIPNKSRI